MARQFAKVYLARWGTDFRSLSAAAQRLYDLILSNPKLSAAGCLIYQPRKWAKYAKDTTPADIDAALGELVAARYVLHDEDTDELLIRSFIRHDRGYRNKFQRKATETAIDGIESHTLAQHARLELEACLQEDLEGAQPPPPEDPSEGWSDDPLQDPSEGWSEANYELETSTTTSTTNSQSSTPCSSADGFAPAPADPVDDDRKVETIIDHIIAKRTEGRRVQDPIAHLRTSRANFARQERLGLDMMLAKRPHMLDSPELAAEFYLAQMARGGAA